MSPDGYRQLLEHVKATGVNVWVQDGSGVDKLTAEQRERYLQASADCQRSAPASGIVYELFVAGKGKTFTAKPKPDAEIASLLAKRSSCGKDTLYFSLRYLPVARRSRVLNLLQVSRVRPGLPLSLSSEFHQD